MTDDSLYITIDKLKEQIKELKEELESYKEQCVGNHSDPEDCPSWHDWCNCGGFLAEHIQQLKEQLEWEVSLKKALLERQEEWAKEMRELKKENIKLRSLTRRASEEIRDLDTIIIKLHDQFPEIKKELNWNSDGYWAGEASINLLNRLDGKTNGGYIENYDDLHLEMKTLGETDSKAENKLTLQEARELTIEGTKRMEELERSQDDDYDYDCDDVRHHCGACGCEPCQCRKRKK